MLYITVSHDAYWCLSALSKAFGFCLYCKETRTSVLVQTCNSDSARECTTNFKKAPYHTFHFPYLKLIIYSKYKSYL